MEIRMFKIYIAYKAELLIPSQVSFFFLSSFLNFYWLFYLFTLHSPVFLRVMEQEFRTGLSVISHS